MIGGLMKMIFGDKKARDVKELKPYVAKINAEFNKLKSISDDQLRAKTAEFRQRIAKHVESHVQEMAAKRAEAEATADIYAKDALYNEIEKVRLRRNKALEEALEEVLPEAFAVVKETARRLRDNQQLVVTATDWDRQIASQKENVVIEGDKAIWSNRWDAAGKEVVWDMVHYDVQLMGGMILHRGRIAEMATGEGKTLVSTLPAYLNALTGAGVHIVTVNDYLARRDAQWNGPLFEFHQITVDCIDLHEPNSEERKAAYRADITFGTNNEFGFDYLRDNMTSHPEHLVQREHHYAIVDEIDSVLIDEARTPLIISGPVPQGDKHEFHALKPRIERLIQGQSRIVNACLTEARKNLQSENKELAKEAGKQLFRAYRGLPKYKPLIKYLSEPGVKTEMLKTEAFYMQEKSKNMHIIDEELYFTIDEKNNDIQLTEKGRELITNTGEDSNLFVMPDVGAAIAEIEQNASLTPEQRLAQKDMLSREFAAKSELLHSINQMVKAYTLFERDVEYIVDEGKVKIVDEQTGRVLAGRRYSDGLHQAIEAKENVKVEATTQTFATVTLQNYFRMYHKLAGMTGTAETEESEFHQIYKLDVVVVPTNRNIVRKDENDLVYKTRAEKYKAVIDEVKKMREAGRPVLVGTTSVEVSEQLSRLMNMAKIPHNVLNAKQHQREAEIVTEAGLAGTVTIATNMAGRGTDIKLGPGVKEAGGLAIIGTERHESRRIDRQLRGRAGRQGDPGSSQFFVSLEDDLMRLFGSERISKIMDRLGLKEGEVIQHNMITQSITRAQKKVEENNFGMRKRLLEYDDVMNSQREVVYKRRRNALFGDRMKVDMDNMLHDLCTEIVGNHYSSLDATELQMECLRLLSVDPAITEQDFNDLREDDMADRIYDAARAYYDRKRQWLSETLLAGLKNIKSQRNEVQFVEIGFTDGHKRIRVVVNIDQAIASDGNAVPETLEKAVMLGVIDEKWKNHLREMDELRTAVQMASLEQKDPLLVYKHESFNIFQEMMRQINREVISLLFKANLEAPNQQQQQQQQAPQVAARVTSTPPPAEKRDDFSKLRARHDDVEASRREELRKMVGNNPQGGQQERPLSRRERRDQERKKK
jgi:preprotein translocase subunit SecA